METFEPNFKVGDKFESRSNGICEIVDIFYEPVYRIKLIDKFLQPNIISTESQLQDDISDRIIRRIEEEV